MRTVKWVWIPVCLLVCTVMAEDLSLPVTRDAKISFHSSEKNFNYGQAHNLRTRGIQTGSGEVVLMDVDRAELQKFIESNNGKELSGQLRLFVRGVSGDATKVEVCALDAGSDWGEGAQNGAQAIEGESCFTAAQFDAQQWQTADGNAVANLRDLLYTKKGDTILTALNKGAVDVAAGQVGQEIVIELDEAILKHLASSKTCRGLVLFNRSTTAKIAFFSKDQVGKAPRLTITAK